MIGSAKDYAQKQNDQAGGQLVQSGQDLLDAVGLVRKGRKNLIIKISHQKRPWKRLYHWSVPSIYFQPLSQWLSPNSHHPQRSPTHLRCPKFPPNPPKTRHPKFPKHLKSSPPPMKRLIKTFTCRPRNSSTRSTSG